MNNIFVATAAVAVHTRPVVAQASRLRHRRAWRCPAALATVLATASTLALSGCSTAPARPVAWSLPQAALVKSEPLPRLADDPARSDDAASTIGIDELVEDNFALVKLYKRLAQRHDELVDAVMQRLREQAR